MEIVSFAVVEASSSGWQTYFNLFSNDGATFSSFSSTNTSSAIVSHTSGGNSSFEASVNNTLGSSLEVVSKDVTGVEVPTMLEVMNMLGVLPIKVLPNELLPVKGVLVVEVLPDIWMLPIELSVERLRPVELSVDGVLLIELSVERVRPVELPVDGVLPIEFSVERVRPVELPVDGVLLIKLCGCLWM